MSARKIDPRSIVEYMQELPDPRVNRRRRHKLVDIVVIAICSTICGGESFVDMEDFGLAAKKWLKAFLELPGGIPSHDTFNRVFSALDPKEFSKSITAWTESLRVVLGQEIVAIDGKSVRRAIRQDKPLPHLVSAWASENGLTLGQIQVDEKSNEITAVPELLKLIDLKDCIVTVDAMGCQKKIAEQVQEKEADYVLALKGNQGAAHEEIKAFLDDAVPQDAPRKSSTPLPSHMDFFKTIDKGHGRIETRRYWQSTDISWFADKDEWPGLRSVGMVESVRRTKDTTSTERRYYMLSLDLDAETFARSVRQHWSIENSLHWVLDVVFGEDDSRARTAHAISNLGTLRRLALNMIKSTPHGKSSIRSRRLIASWDPSYLKKVLGI